MVLADPANTASDPALGASSGDDGARQCWATIRSGLGADLQQPVDLDSSTTWNRTT